MLFSDRNTSKSPNYTPVSYFQHQEIENDGIDAPNVLTLSKDSSKTLKIEKYRIGAIDEGGIEHSYANFRPSTLKKEIAFEMSDNIV